jgi:hypothetical protein
VEEGDAIPPDHLHQLPSSRSGDLQGTPNKPKKKNKKYNDPSSEFAQSNAELYYDISFQILELLVTFMQDFLSDLTTEGAIDRALITNSHVITIASSQLAAGNNKLLDAIFSVLQLLFENKYEPFIIQLYLSSLSLSLSVIGWQNMC